MTVRAYLDYAGFGRLRPPAVAAISEAVQQILPDGSAEVVRLFPARAQARSLAAGLLGATVDEIAFVPNTSTGVHLVADGLDWRPGDEIVVFDRDFPAIVRPWQRLAERGVTLSWVPMRSGGYELADVAAAITPATRLIAVSQVNFATGFRIDLDQICALAAEVGALVCVDAVQSLGVLPLSVADTPVDFLAAGAHKWLNASPGTGIFYCRASRLDLLRSVPNGWFGYEAAGEMTRRGGQLRYDLPERVTAAKVEGGMSDVAGLAGLAAALTELTAIGMPAITERALRIAGQIAAGLTDRGYTLASSAGPQGPSAIVSMVVPDGDGPTVAAKLAAAGIHVSSPDGLIRISPHYWTDDEEAELLLRELPSSMP
jgi:cysteine desulfurase / selenocysteine lyase